MRDGDDGAVEADVAAGMRSSVAACTQPQAVHQLKLQQLLMLCECSHQSMPCNESLALELG